MPTSPDREGVPLAMNTPTIASPQEWQAAREQLLVKEKALTCARDALAAERRRMPWTAVEKAYEFDGPTGKVSLLDLFEGRRQLIVYRAFFEPGVFGWPEHGCRGCSLGADQVAHLAHLNARDTTLAYVSRAPQADIVSVLKCFGTISGIWKGGSGSFGFEISGNPVTAATARPSASSAFLVRMHSLRAS